MTRNGAGETAPAGREFCHPPEGLYFLSPLVLLSDQARDNKRKIYSLKKKKNKTKNNIDFYRIFSLSPAFLLQDIYWFFFLLLLTDFCCNKPSFQSQQETKTQTNRKPL
jgi:hypothetical protein